MGLLDDAIREHLDLKRRRGADPAEIERAEREALGPVRRGPEATLPDQLPADDDDELSLDYEPDAEHEWEEEPTAYHEPAPYDEPESAHDEDRFRDEEPYHDDEPFDPRSAEPPHHGGETAEHDMAQELGKEGEDVLEETPEFLQDAPEHDRLWFEQRPPRDFDFNE
jgi:hypothetical protein